MFVIWAGIAPVLFAFFRSWMIAISVLMPERFASKEEPILSISSCIPDPPSQLPEMDSISLLILW
jgi:hypothetical protein